MNEYKQRSGHPRKLENNRKNPFDSAPNIATVLQTSLDTIVSSDTVWKSIEGNGCKECIARKKLFVSDTDINKMFEFAKTYQLIKFVFWDKVIFSDESKYNIFGYDRRLKVWRKRNEELQIQLKQRWRRHGLELHVFAILFLLFK